MKMTDNNLKMTFQTNCDSINSNGVEISSHNNAEETKAAYDITKMEIVKNAPNDDNMEGETQENAIDQLIKREDDNNSDLFNNEPVQSSSDNNIKGVCKMEVDELVQEIPSSGKRKGAHFFLNCYIARRLKKRSIRCLNKMQIMEDVREGCNVQPSSPGHADQRNNEADDEPLPTIENGFCNDKSTHLQSDTFIEEQSNKRELDENHKNDKVEENDIIEIKTEPNNFIEETDSNGSTPIKRKIDEEEEEDSANKKLRSAIHENFIARDKILNEYIELTDCSNIEQIHSHTDQILAEIRTLNELAREKEREWNNIIHLKKLKEELLIRMQRKKHIILNEYNDFQQQNENVDDQVSINRSQSAHSILKANLTRLPKKKHPRNLLPKTSNQIIDFNDFRQARQRPLLDVQSIIADYRQRHPEAVPRRGRRIRHSQSDKNPNVLNYSSMGYGAGSQGRHADANSELGLLLNTMNGARSDGLPMNLDGLTQSQETSYKDVLVQFAKLSQSERHELIQNAIKPPPPYPEVTVHPVPTTAAPPTNSLLHGILTKSPTNSTKTSFSPTLARLLTAPERAVNNVLPTNATINSIQQSSNMSISEILSTSKARNEITITPVGSQFDIPVKRSNDTEEAEDSADRLVIDESNETIDGHKGDTSSDAGDEIPMCQGCNQKPSQFVCAGCGNQWYCSRDCQVSSWDEHSEVCSG